MLKFTSPLASLKKTTQIFSSLIFVIKDYINYTKASFRAYSVFRLLQILQCNIKVIQINYIFMGKVHLEINSYGGVFINESHRLVDTIPYIIVIDNNLQLSEDLNLILQDYLLYAKPYNINFTTANKLPTIKNLPFNSVALNMALEKFTSLLEIENFLKMLKLQLIHTSVVFGFSYLPLHQFKNSKKAVKYINNKINAAEWHLKHYTLDDLENLFYKYFEDVEITIEGSIFTFKLSNNYQKPDFSSVRITKENAGNKYIEINND